MACRIFSIPEPAKPAKAGRDQALSGKGLRLRKKDPPPKLPGGGMEGPVNQRNESGIETGAQLSPAIGKATNYCPEAKLLSGSRRSGKHQVHML